MRDLRLSRAGAQDAFSLAILARRQNLVVSWSSTKKHGGKVNGSLTIQLSASTKAKKSRR
ncbi:hypothetical protein Kim5_PA00009 (plasmid) [Rhizobium sp. Kim5]|nr:hypothetical protein Kim5_PA00009 [Rhizobium sp. Kim5]